MTTQRFRCCCHRRFRSRWRFWGYMRARRLPGATGPRRSAGQRGGGEGCRRKGLSSLDAKTLISPAIYGSGRGPPHTHTYTHAYQMQLQVLQVGEGARREPLDHHA